MSFVQEKINKAAIWQDRIAVLLGLALLVPWLYVQLHMTINSDTAWLYLCAEHILQGGNHLLNCNDPNPPLSSMIYAPMAWLSKISSLEPYVVILAFTFTLIFFGVYTTYTGLKTTGTLSSFQRTNILFGYIAAITIIPSIYFTEREHYLSILAVPYILNSLAITYRKQHYSISSILLCILASIAFLIKPHYGLIPASLFLHRIWVRKNLSILKDIDFISLSLLTLIYLISLFTVFKSYSFDVFPDVVHMYLPYSNVDGVIDRLPLVASITGIAIICAALIPFSHAPFTRFLSLSSVFCILIFIMQGKGLTYHLLPVYVFCIPVLMCAAYKLSQLYIPKARAALIPLCLILCFWRSPLLPLYATHDTYKNNPVTQALDKYCPSSCNFYMTHENMDVMNQLILYTDHVSANRFPSFWFEPAFNGDVELSDEWKDRLPTLMQKYSDYIADDLSGKKPQILLIQNNNNEPVAPFFKYAEHSEHFNEVMDQYEKVETITLDRSMFYKNTKYDFPYPLRWDVYLRKE